MIRRFFKDSFVYTLATLFTKGIGLIMLPVYLNYLSKTEFGAFDYLNALSMVLAVIITFEISQSVMRFVADAHSDDVEKSQYVSAATWFLFLSFVVFNLIVYLFRESISISIFGFDDNSHVVLYASVACCTSAFLYFSTVLFRAKLEAKKSVIISFSSALLVALFSVLLLSVFELKLTGVLLGQIFGQLLVVFFVLVYLRNLWFRLPRVEYLLEMLRFSFPLVFSSLGVIAFLYVDRFFIKELLDLESVAVYGVGARFAAIATLCTIGFQSALTPLIYSKYNEVETPSNIRKLLSYYVLASSIVIVIFTIVSDYLVLLVAGEEYIEAAPLVVLLCLSVLIHSSYVFFPGLLIAKRTKVLAIINILVAFINVVFNYVFIQAYGVIGAAFATLLSSFIYVFINLYFSESIYPVVFNKRKAVSG